jgi:hypothetical protein
LIKEEKYYIIKINLNKTIDNVEKIIYTKSPPKKGICQEIKNFSKKFKKSIDNEKCK